jgi:hypothetical protein
MGGKGIVQGLWRGDVLNEPGGFGLIEVIFAMTILAFAVIGVMGAFQWADHGLQLGIKSAQALAMAQSRLEAKRAGRWSYLLYDDLDGDGTHEVLMHDDGRPPDVKAGDGIYTAGVEQFGIQLVWTLRPEPRGNLMDAALVVMEAQASYATAPGRRGQVHLAALRGNPVYVGALP